MASICFILMLASFYKRTLSAVAGTTILWFLTYVPYILSLNSLRVNVWELNIFVMAFHNTVLGYITENILEFELFGRGFNFQYFFDTRPLDNTVSIGYYLGIMLIQSCMYTCISLYVDELMPGNFGLPKSWNYLFNFKKRSSISIYLRLSRRFGDIYAEGSDASAAAASGRSTLFIYEVAGGRNVILVDMKNVCKSYGDETVLNNITLQLYSNEITVLLGHNGAGKTTLLSIIGGLVAMTSGSITIEGFDINKDQRYACASLGLCMGDSVLYQNLTVEDQIRFFGYLKGLQSKAVERELERYLGATKLIDYRMIITRKLPAGIRQQLSICCALMGQSRVVLLDCPMTHMDLPGRKLMWKLLEQEKVQRTILITTSTSHILEGIGDRVIIMSNGELQCDGTPSFLKKMYGQGYRLVSWQTNSQENIIFR